MAEKTKCVNCDMELEAGWLACPRCGVKVEASPPKCRNCGKELQAGWQSCPFCATPVAAASGGGAAVSAAAPAAPSGELAELLEQAGKLDAEEKYEEAIAVLTQALRIDGGSAKAYQMRGRAYRLNGDYTTAIADYTRAIQIDPQFAGAFAGRGDSYSGNEDADAAIADYTRAIQIEPQNQQAFLGRGRAYFYGNDDNEAALKDLTKALSIVPDDYLTLATRAGVYMRMDRYEAAIADWTALINVYPDNSYGFQNRARCYWVADNNQNAMRDIKKALGLDPNDADNHFWHGRILLSLDNKENSAFKAFTRAIELDSSDPYYFIWRGNTCHVVGLNDEAKSDYLEALELDPDLDKTDKSLFWYQPSGCYITTAVCRSFDKSDNCPELTAFRHFRDTWLATQSGGGELIQEYYRTAPRIVAAIDKSPAAAAVYRSIWDTWLADCLQHISEQQFEQCGELYTRMVRELERQWLPGA